MKICLPRRTLIAAIGISFLCPLAHLKCLGSEGSGVFNHTVELAGQSHIAPLHFGLNQTIDVNLSGFGSNLYLKQVVITGVLNTYGGSWVNDVAFQFRSPGSFSGNFSLYPASGQFQNGNGIGVGPASTTLDVPFTVSNDRQLSILLFDTSYDVAGQPDATWQSGAIELTIGQCLPADMSEPYGLLNFFDVSKFLEAFGSHDPSADVNGDGEFNFFDVSTFLSAFTNGCP